MFTRPAGVPAFQRTGDVIASQRGFHVVVAAGILTVLGSRVLAGEPRPPAVMVRIFDQSVIADEILTRAKEDVARIYRETGVDVVWLDADPGSSARQFIIHLIIRKRGSRHALGTTLGDVHDTGATAFVYKDAVLQWAHEREQDVARVLAYAIAHEMGHALLLYPSHFDIGIMRSEWGEDDLRHIANMSLRFSATQAAAIRAKLSGCCNVIAPATTSCAAPQIQMTAQGTSGQADGSYRARPAALSAVTSRPSSQLPAIEAISASRRH
jgi:hypothetical protein